MGTHIILLECYQLKTIQKEEKTLRLFQLAQNIA